ncbi:uncharacterized protein LOC126691236 [Quercus robur]|uniref:uncharacterized protein LOC126691236 n=1 Tax=Quercus robur TaxID=38942 RepID=UPI0021633665|nr:uncharacterized protein LOC126691236 [Quercus robur]
MILTAPGRTGSFPSTVMSIERPLAEDLVPDPKRSKAEVRPALSFSDEDKVGTSQPYDDALVVTLRIREYDVKRVQGLKLRPEDLTSYNSPLVGFDRKTVFPKGQVRLLVQALLEVVEVDFIVVDAYSPYTAIVARPWLHAMGAVSSSFHLKVKYPSRGQVEELVGSQSIARQCLVAAIRH